MHKHGVVSILLLVLLVGLPALSQASQHWVSVSGDDGAPGTADRPFRTIARGVAAAKPGDTVFVRAGRYEECVALGAANCGTPDQWITISAAPGDERKAVVGTERPHVDAPGSGSSAFALSEVSYVRLRGLKCVAPYRGRGSGIGIHRSHHVEVLNCIATGGGQGGIDANSCDFITIDGAEVYFNGGGTGWSSGISLWEPTGTNNVIRNCVLYGNYDNSSYRTDGNGIIIDGSGPRGGCLMVNNLAFMNGGKGLCSTRCDNCTFLNNTSTANCWDPVQQGLANEFNVRGANNLLRNNIGVSVFPGGAGMVVLPSYGGDRPPFDVTTIHCDHNLFHSATDATSVMVLGEQVTRMTLDQLRTEYPYWADSTLDATPGFVDAKHLDFRLRSDSPAVGAGAVPPEVPTDITGTPRPGTGTVSLGCYEGGAAVSQEPQPEPGVGIAPGEDEAAIRGLLANEYDLDWHGMLWGWGRMLPEELPLQVDVQGPRRKDFLNLTGRFALKELLDTIAREHEVRLVLSQPGDGRGLGTSPDIISSRLAIKAGAGAEERARVRALLRSNMWTNAEDPVPFAEVLPALSAALGLRIESDPPLPPNSRFAMTTLNMRLTAFLTDLADRMNVRFTISVQDPLLDQSRVRAFGIGEHFGGPDGVIGLTVNRPEDEGHIDLYARVQTEARLCAEVTRDGSRFISTAGSGDGGEGSILQTAATRLDPGGTVRLAVVGQGCALNVGDQWVLLGRLPASLSAGGFYVVSDSMEVQEVRFAPLD